MRRRKVYDLNILKPIRWFERRLRKELDDPFIGAFRNVLTNQIEIWRISHKDGKPYFITQGGPYAEDYATKVIHDLRAWDCWDKYFKQVIRELNDYNNKADVIRLRREMNKFEDRAREMKPLVAKMAWEMPADNIPKKARPRPDNLDEVPASQWWSK